MGNYIKGQGQTPDLLSVPRHHRAAAALVHASRRPLRARGLRRRPSTPLWTSPSPSPCQCTVPFLPDPLLPSVGCMYLRCLIKFPTIGFRSRAYTSAMAAAGHPLDNNGPVRDWAPPGWHWELSSGTRSLVRNPGEVADPDLVWWRSRGPGSFQREPAPEEEVRRRIREEDAHVRRYMHLLDTMYTNTWQAMQRNPYHVSIYPVMVPTLWVISAPRDAPRGLVRGRS